MRKHRFFGVVIAVLLGTGLLALRPSAPHQATRSGFGQSGIQLASAKTPPTGGAVHAQGFSAPADIAQTADPFIELSAYMNPAPSPAPPAPKPAASPAPVTAPSGDVWLRLRECESSDNYADNTGNGYYGAYQFSESTWQGLGLGGLPSDAPPTVQDAAAQRLQARSGWGQWPVCSRELGL